jgi:hypothetical protein
MRLLAVLAALTLAVAPAAPAAGAPSLAASGCPLFPADSADFGSGTWEGGPIGIPFTVVPPGQPRVPVRFGSAAESDPGPYPIPPGAPVEGGPDAGGDRHVLVVQAGSCRLYQLFDAHREGASWRAGVGLGGFPSQARVILQAMRTYGLVADNGSSGFIGGVPDERWDNDALHQLGRVALADFEAVDTAPLRVSPDSAAAGLAARVALRPRQEPSGRHVRAATPGTKADPGTAPAERARATPPPR